MANTKVTSAVIADNAVGIDQLNVSDGTNGQVLTTNGSGTLSFSTISGYTDSDVETYLDGGTSTPTFSTITSEGTVTINPSSGDAVLNIQNGADTQTLRIDQNSIRTTTNSDIHIFTNGNTNQLFLNQSSGKVGIGTSNPAQGKVDILNNGDYDAHTGHGLTIISNVNDAFTAMYMGADDSIDSVYIQSAGKNTSFTSKKLLLNPNGGNVGINTSSPSEALHVNSRAKIGNITLAGNSTDSTLSAGNANFKISTLQFTGGAGGLDFDIFLAITGGIQRVFQVEASGAGDTYTNDGTISSLSDERVKTDIQDLTDGLEIVKQLRPVTFKYNDTSTSEEGHKLMGGASDKVRYGFIAQEVEQIAPQYVEYSTRKINNEEVDDFRNLSTTRMLPMLFKAVQEQQTIIDDLKARIETLENA